MPRDEASRSRSRAPRCSSVCAAEVEGGRLRNRGGQAVTQPIDEGLVREDGKVLYPIDDGIPVMLIEESIEL